MPVLGQALELVPEAGRQRGGAQLRSWIVPAAMRTLEQAGRLGLC